MGWDVHLHVALEASGNDTLRDIAQGLLDGGFAGTREAVAYLTALTRREGYNEGAKGGLSLWGIVGNHTSGESFVRDLIPFWETALNEDYDPDGDGPLGFEHIIVFVEEEQSAHATAYEIYKHDHGDPWPGGVEPPVGSLVILKHALPFHWAQA